MFGSVSCHFIEAKLNFRPLLLRLKKNPMLSASGAKSQSESRVFETCFYLKYTYRHPDMLSDNFQLKVQVFLESVER